MTNPHYTENPVGASMTPADHALLRRYRACVKAYDALVAGAKNGTN